MRVYVVTELIMATIAGSNSSRSTYTYRPLICDVCNSVYEHPKLLPCLHTFCLKCVQELARDQGPASFRCPIPQCQKVIQVPDEDPEHFSDNIYITKEDLHQQQLKGMPEALCQEHQDPRLLEFYCVHCDKSICLSCKLTEHLEHPSEDIAKAAERAKNRLAREKPRLDAAVQEMVRVTTLTGAHLKAAHKKMDILREQVNSEYQRVIARAAFLRDKVLDGLDIVAGNIEQELLADDQKANEAHKALVSLQERVGRILNGNAIDAEAVAIEKEMRVGRGSKQSLDKLNHEFEPRDTPRPVLHSLAHSLKESLERDLLLYLGFPNKLMVPRVFADGRERFTSVFRCGEGSKANVNREVHALFRSDDARLHVAYGGRPPSYSDERVVQLNQEGARINEILVNKRVTFNKGVRTGPNTPEQPENVEITEANSNGLFQIRTQLLNTRKITIKSKTSQAAEAAPARPPLSFEINYASQPRGFDADASGNQFVVISEDEGPSRGLDEVFTTSGNFRNFDSWERRQDRENVVLICRQLKLYRRNHSDPISVYAPPTAAQNFLPTAVSFWKSQGEPGQEAGQEEELLLVTDWWNDCVHVIRIANGEFQFLRFMHGGCGDLVRPTALDVDRDGTVWIGCQTGHVLRCQRAPEAADDADLQDEHDNDSIGHLQDEHDNDSVGHLTVEIGSEQSNVSLLIE